MSSESGDTAMADRPREGRGLLSIPNPQLTLFLRPVEPTATTSYEVDLSRIFREILDRANEFVPSEAGAIYLEDATARDGQRSPETLLDVREVDEETRERTPELVIVTSFGTDAERLLGARLPVGTGIAGLVHDTGEAYVSTDPDDRLLARRTDDSVDVRSVIAVPLHLGPDVVGVLELLNQRDGGALSDHDLDLLKVFAQTISVSIANAMEAQRSKEMARRDDLTRLYNDRYLHHSLSLVLEKALADGQDCGLVFFDLDYFKRVNDTFGHLAGSRLLREIGDLLRRVLPGSALAARYGGDEFVVILPEAARQETYWVAETIRKTIEEQVFLEQADPRDPANYPALGICGITASLGLATLVSDTLEASNIRGTGELAVKNEMLRRADMRMYRAKEGGRNRTVSDSEDPAES